MLDLIDTVATVIQTGVVVLGIRYAVVSIREGAASRGLEIIKSAIDGLSTPEGYVERYAILERGRVRPEDLSREDYLLYLRICDQFQRVCSLARRDPVAGDHLIRMFSATMVSIWRCVEDFVRDVRERRGLTNFAEDFEWFATRSADYRRQRFPDEILRLGLNPPDAQAVAKPTDPAASAPC